MLTAKSAAACATTTKLRLSLNMMLGRRVQILSGCAALTLQRGVVALVILGFPARREMAQTVAVAAPVQASRPRDQPPVTDAVPKGSGPVEAEERARRRPHREKGPRPRRC